MCDRALLRLFALTALALAACAAEPTAAPTPPPPAPLAPPAPKREVNAQPKDDSFAVILETGGFGREALLTIDITGTPHSAEATCATQPGQQHDPAFRAWKRSATLTAERITALWEPLERIEWEVQKSHGAARDPGSASLLFRKGQKVREFLAQPNCGCSASPKPACCAGAVAIDALRELCRSPELNVPPQTGPFTVEVRRRAPDGARSVTTVRGDDAAAQASRQEWDAKGRLRLWSGTLSAPEVLALWKPLNAAGWPRLQQLTRSPGEHGERMLLIDRAGTWVDVDLDAPGGSGVAGLTLEVDRAAAARGVHEVVPHTQVTMGPRRQRSPGATIFPGTCEAKQGRVSCTGKDALSQLRNSACFPVDGLKDVYACGDAPSDSQGVLVRSNKPVHLPETPHPWKFTLATDDECGGPPPIRCNEQLTIDRLVEGPNGWFAVPRGGGPPVAVRVLYTHPFAPKHR